MSLRFQENAKKSKLGVFEVAVRGKYATLIVWIFNCFGHIGWDLK